MASKTGCGSSGDRHEPKRTVVISFDMYGDSRGLDTWASPLAGGGTETKIAATNERINAFNVGISRSLLYGSNRVVLLSRGDLNYIDPNISRIGVIEDPRVEVVLAGDVRCKYKDRTALSYI